MPNDIVIGDITAFVSERPAFFVKTKIYDPTVINAPPGQNNVIPSVDSLIIDPSNDTLWVVQSVDPTTHASTLVPAVMSVNNDTPTLESVVSYMNDIFRVYYDARSNPISLQVDGKLKLYGLNNSSYQLIRYPNTPNAAPISLYYNSSGVFEGNNVPMVSVNSSNTAWACANCNIPSALTDGEMLELQIFNSYGAQQSSVIVFAKAATIVNESAGPQPVIVGMTIGSSQLRSNNEIYIFQNQSVDDLNITVTLNYDDGHSQEVAIDYTRCYIYGLTGFVASYEGLNQEIIIKYFLATGESVSPTLLDISGSHVTQTMNIVVVSNELAPSAKISVVPRWSVSGNTWILYYYLYTTDRSLVSNITAYVTISVGTFSGTLYGQPQTITLSVDLSQVFPEYYTTPSIYQQQCIITLQPISQLQRYIERDSSNSAYVYGVDTPTMHRPVLYFDTTRQQYFVPTSLFPTSADFIAAFYTNAAPPYDITTETTPPVPTHFILRDISTGLSVVSAPIPIANYSVAFSLAASTQNYLVGTNVIVEFLQYVNSETTLILFGSPVDVYTAVTPYQGS